MLIDYHTHLERGPYTLEYLGHFVSMARRQGVEEICITEHGHSFYESWHLLDNDWPLKLNRRHLSDYIELINAAKTRGWPVRLGLEMDYISSTREETARFLTQNTFDFVLGSVHWVDGFGFDNPEWIEEWEHRSVDELYRRYFTLLREAVESKMFDAIAHPDVIKIFGHRPTFCLTGEYGLLAECLRDNDVCLEVSTAGWRKPVNELYPHLDLLRLCLAHGVKLTLASDAHEPKHVGFGYARAVPILRELGVKELSTFSGRKFKAVQL